MALIPSYFLSCVVALGTDDEQGKRQWIASGFFYGLFQGSAGDAKTYRVVLVTNRHVVIGLKTLWVRVDAKAPNPPEEYQVPLTNRDGSQRWYGHANPDIDVAVLPIDFQTFMQRELSVSFFGSDLNTVRVPEMANAGISEGDAVYVLGFPMGLVGKEQNFVVARSGSIARIRDLIEGSTNYFLLDAAVFPGNSGGPVISKPEAMAIAGTKPVGMAYVIGIVRGYLTYQEVAVSSQTHQPRVVFQENSGLVEVHPIDYVEELIQAFVSQHPD
jgi:S1-C subfamily serine protease